MTEPEFLFFHYTNQFQVIAYSAILYTHNSYVTSIENEDT